MSHPISEVIFQHKFDILSDFRNYVSENKIRLPHKSNERREIFINWYLEKFDKQNIETNISDLSRYFLYISEHRIYELLFTTKEKNITATNLNQELESDLIKYSIEIAKPVNQYDKHGKFITKFISIREAERITGISRNSISQCTQHRQKYAGGYEWETDYS